MRIAVCSLSEFTHLAEFLDATSALGKAHELRYFPGHRTKAGSKLLADHRIDHAYTFRRESDRGCLTDPDSARNTEGLFREYFFRHAELALPALIENLQSRRPDLIISHFRDYAGATAAEYLDIPLLTFGSHQSPCRDECVDPPPGAGQDRNAPGRKLEVAWKLHRQFNERIDEVFNSTIRRPLGLDDLVDVSAFHSRTLTLLSLPSFMSNKNSPEPAHIRFVGPQFTKRLCKPDQREHQLLSQVATARQPRVLLALGTTYNKSVLPKLLAALGEFEGTLVVAGTTQFTEEIPANVLAGSFCEVDTLHRMCDAVVTTGAGKSATDALRHGLAMLCIPRQGEQMENALALESLGAATISSTSPTGRGAILSQLMEVIESPRYMEVARELGSRMKQYSCVCDHLIGGLIEKINSGCTRKERLT